MSQIQRLVTKVVSTTNLAAICRIRLSKNTPAALRMLANKWKGPMLARIVVELVRNSLTLATACGTLPLGMSHAEKVTAVLVINLLGVLGLYEGYQQIMISMGDM